MQSIFARAECAANNMQPTVTRSVFSAESVHGLPRDKSRLKKKKWKIMLNQGVKLKRKGE